MSPTLPPVTRAVIVSTVLVYLLQQVSGDTLLDLFALWPVSDPRFQPWQLLTYGFLHEGDLRHLDIAHIFFNMFALLVFGPPLERLWDSARFSIYYLACVLSAAVIELVVENAVNAGTAAVGASGGVFGLLLAFAWYFPKEKMILLVLLVTLYGVMEVYLGVTGKQPGVAHFAHLGGLLGGALMLLYWRMRGRFVS